MRPREPHSERAGAKHARSRSAPPLATLPNRRPRPPRPRCRKQRPRPSWRRRSVANRSSRRHLLQGAGISTSGENSVSRMQSEGQWRCRRPLIAPTASTHASPSICCQQNHDLPAAAPSVSRIDSPGSGGVGARAGPWVFPRRDCLPGVRSKGPALLGVEVSGAGVDSFCQLLDIAVARVALDEMGAGNEQCNGPLDQL